MPPAFWQSRNYASFLVRSEAEFSQAELSSVKFTVGKLSEGHAQL
jgi:hypothetical protein